MHLLLIALIAVGCGTESRLEPSAPVMEPEPEVVEPPPEEQPEPVWIDVAVGRGFSCGARGDGQVFCWGSNADGRAGLGEVPHSPVPLLVEGIDDAVALSAGEAHACALRREGRVACWGRNRYGQLGDGTTENRLRPIAVDVRDAVELDTGLDHSCVRTDAGEVWCWGRASMIGDGTQEQRSRPVRVRGVSNAVGLSVGYATSCALDEAGGVMCWGFDTGGIFEGRPGPEETPRRVLAEDPVASITFGRDHACFTRRDGVTFCAGNGEHGALGDQNVPDDARCEPEGDELVCTYREPPPPREPEDSETPRPCCPEAHRRLPEPLPEVRRYRRRTGWVHSAVRRDAKASNQRTCFLGADRAVTCFGRLSHGDDWGHRRLEPVEGTAKTTRFDVHDDHGCAIVGDGSMVCWGDGRTGALGDGSSGTRARARSIRTAGAHDP